MRNSPNGACTSHFVIGWWFLIISGGAGGCQIKDVLYRGPADLTSHPRVMFVFCSVLSIMGLLSNPS